MLYKNLKWIFLIVLSIIWGTSLFLIKKATLSFNAYQVGALIMVFSAIVILPFGFKSLKNIQKKHYGSLFIIALFSTFIPSFMFTIAIGKIGISMTSILNSLTPLNTLWLGFFMFTVKFSKSQVIGLVIGFIGLLVYFLTGDFYKGSSEYIYSLLVIFSSLGYALNSNLIMVKLKSLNAISITTSVFLITLIPSLIVLFYTDFFQVYDASSKQVNSLIYILFKAVIGTALAMVMYNKLVHISSAVFASSVTYLIPIVALIWGYFDGEKVTIWQFFAGVLILLGVYIANRARLSSNSLLTFRKT
ncbi:MAG: DMT family transporter [Flavobacteriaceae bacterium]|nr:DMT family transporter [Flavobacteriaceae bacterium]